MRRNDTRPTSQESTGEGPKVFYVAIRSKPNRKREFEDRDHKTLRKVKVCSASASRSFGSGEVEGKEHWMRDDVAKERPGGPFYGRLVTKSE